MSRAKPKALTAQERRVLQRAMEKDQRGETLNQAELRVVDKATKIGVADRINELLSHVPAKAFFDAIGDSKYKVQKFIDAVGVPIPKIPGETFDLKTFFQWFYRFHQEQRFIPKSGDEALEYLDINDKLRFEKYKRERIARLRDEKKYVPVDLIYEVVYQFTTVLRVTAERIGQRYGEDVFDEINDAVDEARETITENLYSDDGTETINDDGESEDE